MVRTQDKKKALETSRRKAIMPENGSESDLAEPTASGAGRRWDSRECGGQACICTPRRPLRESAGRCFKAAGLPPALSREAEENMLPKKKRKLRKRKNYWKTQI